MKIVLCAIITFLCGIYGFSVKAKIYKKYQLYADINAFLHYISIKIAFFKDIYADCIYSFVNSQQIQTQELFKSIAQLIENGNLNKNNFSLLLAQYNLTPKEKDEIFNIFSHIGTTDANSQHQILQGDIKWTEYKLTSLKMQKTTTADVWAKLGICIGLVISILIY